MGGRAASRGPAATRLFDSDDDTSSCAPAWSPRAFVTNDELRACLSQHVLAPWLDHSRETGESPQPTYLIAFDGPVAIRTLDSLRSRGPNTHWIGLELDPSVVTIGAAPPAKLPAVIPLSRVRRIVFDSQDERDRFEATKLANVVLPTELTTVDSTWFAADDQHADLPVDMSAADTETAAAATHRTTAFRRLFGAAIAVLDGTDTDGASHVMLTGLTIGTGAAAHQRLSANSATVVSLCGTPRTPSGDTAVTTWRMAAGATQIDEPTEPLAIVDRLVRRELIEHLRGSDDPTLDRQRLSAIIESAAAAAKDDERLRGAADRYPKAVATIRRLWRNEVTWDNVLLAWPDGFPTLLASTVMASVDNVDQYDVLHKRLVDLALPAEVARLARLFFGLRWGIEAIPSHRRGSRAVQRFVETVTWSTQSPQPSTPSLDCRLERAKGRSASRPYVLTLEHHGASVDIEVELADVVEAKLRRALQTASDAVSRALVDLAAEQPAARPYLTWRVRLPKSSFQTDLERGRPVLSGSMADGSPSVEYVWSDWSAFTDAAMRPTGILTDLKRPTDLAAWDRAIDDVLTHTDEVT